MKKFLFSMMLLVVMILNSQITIFAATNNIKVVYFTSKSCFSCHKVNKEIDNLKNELVKKDVNLEIITYDISQESNKDILINYGTEYNLKDDEINVYPIVFIGDKYYMEKDKLVESLESEINTMVEKSEIKEVKQVNQNNNSFLKSMSIYDGFTPIAVVIAGLIDGINPCAIAMLLFFISFLKMSDKNNKQILITGFLFVLATFLAYFGIGVGLLNIGYIFKDMKLLLILMYGITIIMSLYLAVLHFNDYFNIKKGKINEVKTQLSKGRKHFIHRFIRKYSSTKIIYVSSFVSGFVIAFLEFSCTGQVYLPTITYLITSKASFNGAIIYLILYNLAFVLPLILIVISIFYGKKVVDISSVLTDNLANIKIMGSIFFAIMSVFMIMQLVKII